jgi:hypothetical protein
VTESSVELHGVTASSSAEEQLPVSERSDNHVKLDDLLQVGDVCVATSRGPPSLSRRSSCKSSEHIVVKIKKKKTVATQRFGFVIVSRPKR